ncbi:FYVE and coiled-coil domain-containing protein 1-like [Watersipora subatra]|uniref:FYVE and coiled-coil domain-containing protein 1-like n=1 Tax=Watersipora subatra TaxID=2589382 RepID=UPI00355B0F38
MYQRLADCLQLCTSNTKLTSHWYKPTSVWRDASQATYLVSMLYDLNDVTFDLGAQGYDLDNGWPTFSRTEGSGQRWNLSSLSRSSSISSFSQSMFTPNSSFMSSSYMDPETQRIVEQRDGRSDSDLPNGVGNNEPDSVSIAADEELMNGISKSVAILEGARENLREEVDDVRSQLSASDARSIELERRLADAETRNKELVASLNQLVHDQSVASSAQAGQLSKYQDLVDRYTKLEAFKSEKERECDQLLSAHSALEEKLAILNKECAERQTTIDQMAQDKSDLEETLSTIANSLMEKSNFIETMTNSHASQLNDIQTRHSSQLSELRTSHASQFNELQTTHDSLLSDYATLKKVHELLQGSHLSLESHLSSLSIDHEALRSSHQQLELTQTGATDYTESLKAQLATALCHHKESEEVVLQLKAEIKSANEREIGLNQRCEELESVNSALNSGAVEQKNEIMQRKDESSELNVKIAELSSTLLIREEQLQTSTKQNDESSAMVQQMRCDLTKQQEELSSILQENTTLQGTISRYESENAQLQDSMTSLESSQQQLQLDFNSNKKLYCSTEEKLVSQEALLSEKDRLHNLQMAENEEAQKELVKKLEASTAEMSTLRLAAEKMEKEREEVGAQCSRQHAEIGELEQQLVHIHTAHESLQAAHTQLETECSSRKEELTTMTSRNKELELERERLGKEVQELQERLKSMQQRVAQEESEQEQSSMEMSSKCEQLALDKQTLQGSLSSVGEELAVVKAERDALIHKLEEEQQVKQELSVSLTQVSGETETLKSCLKSLKAEALEKGSELSELQTRFDSTKVDLLNKQSVMEQQIGALRFQISSQQMEADLTMEGYKTQQQEVNSMAQTISTQERQIASIQLQLDTLVDERSLETDIHSRQVDELVFLLDEKEAELLSLVTEMATYKDEWDTLTESNRTMKKSLVELKLDQGTQRAKAENELHQLREDNTMLMKRLVKLIKDKDTLWQTTDELMSKNQQRVVTWVSSADVTNCMGCNSAFTMLLRKHHCRVCGKVFCWQCCNNWTLTGSGSRRKERCCNQCYIEKREPAPAESLNSSIITGENSVDSVTIPTLPVRRFSLTSDVSSPTDDSRRSTPERSSVTRPLRDTSPDNQPDTTSFPNNSEGDQGVETLHGEENQATFAQELITPSETEQEPVLEEQELIPRVCDQEEKEQTESEPLEGEHTGHEQTERELLLTDKTDSFQTNGEFREREHSEESSYAVKCMATHEDEGVSLTRSDSLREEYNVVLDAETGQLSEPVETSIQALSQHTVCVIVDKEDTTLAWTLMSQSKPVYFQLDFKPSTTGFSQGNEILIPECKCRSHKREFKGEMVSHNSGFFIFTFINKSESELTLQYLITLA